MGFHGAVGGAEVVDEQSFGNVAGIVFDRCVAGRCRNYVVAPRAIGGHPVEVVGETVGNRVAPLQQVGRSGAVAPLVIDQSEEVFVVLEYPVGARLRLLALSLDTDDTLVEIIGSYQVVNAIDGGRHDDGTCGWRGELGVGSVGVVNGRGVVTAACCRQGCQGHKHQRRNGKSFASVHCYDV